MSKVVARMNGVTFTYNAPEYSTSAAYTNGDVVMRNDQLYQCVTPTKGGWLPSHWQAVTLEQLINDELDR